MDNQNLVVARHLDGQVTKGVTRDFTANRPLFHVESETGEVVELRTRDLKAIFFVKSLQGNPSREDVPGFIAAPAETRQGRKIAVRFRDGEYLCGYALSWSPEREGFFVFPADAGNNNLRIWVLSAATREIESGPRAELFAERIVAEVQAIRASGLHPRPAGFPQKPPPGENAA